MRYAVIICTDTNAREALEEYQKARERRARRERLRRQRRWYFFKQKLVGVALLGLTALAVSLLDGDATIAVLTVPMGLYLIISKEMLLVNNFYWETKERRKKCNEE